MHGHKMNVHEIVTMMCQVSSDMVKQEKLLCQLDSGIGDGDHGVTVARGFKAVETMLKATEFNKPGEVFEHTGKCLSDAMGGAIGPILGSFFEAGRVLEQEETGCQEFAAFFSEGLKQVCITGGAKEGDRTMVDALIPAVQAFNEEAKKWEGDNLSGLEVCFKQAYEAAKSGAEHTKELMAKKGRARFLREKSLGYVDAGAMTMTLIFCYMWEYAGKDKR